MRACVRALTRRSGDGLALEPFSAVGDKASAFIVGAVCVCVPVCPPLHVCANRRGAVCVRVSGERAVPSMQSRVLLRALLPSLAVSV